MDFNFLNGYVPDANSHFAFLDGVGRVSGDFTSLDFMGINCPSCTFDLSSLSLDTGSTPPTPSSTTPEPASVILFGTVLLGLGPLLQHKRAGVSGNGSHGQSF